jgi:hypothetical protein
MELFMNKGDDDSGLPAHIINTSIRSVVYAIAIKIFKAIAYSLMIL